MQALLDVGGADLDAKEILGHTAFLLACVTCRVDCLEALSKAGCDKEARNKLANAHGHSVVVDWLCAFAAG